MPSYFYTAIDEVGRARRGTLEAASEECAAAVVRGMGLYPTKLGCAAASRAGGVGGQRAPWGMGRVIGRQGLAEFTRQLGTLLQAGLPLLRALQVLERQESRPRFRWVVGELARAIVAGEGLAQAMERQGRVFSTVYLGMVRAGEAGGHLEVALLQLARFLEKAERVRRRVRAALAYPAAVLAVTGLILTGLMVFVVPRFRLIFQEQLRGAPMPGLTRVVLAASDGVVAHWPWLVVIVLGLGGLRWALAGSTRGRWLWDALVLRVPAVGELGRKMAVARMARTLGTLLGNGVPILQALEVARDTAGNRVYSGALDKVREQVQAGQAVAAALAAPRRFPERLVSLVAVGEETGALAEMLGRVADAYEEEVDTAVGGLTALLEPLLIVFLAVTVGTIVLALFLPIVRIIQTMS